jgi:CMP-N-acetylneuraminic acid synthetase/regulator of RNase E activity RraA
MKTVAFVPVKKNSSRIENKNTKLLDGKELFLHTVEKLLCCDFIDEVYVDTESQEIINIAEHTGCKFLIRDISLANNKTDGNALFYNEIRQVDADIYIQVLCTSPFIRTETIEEGVNKVKNGDYDSAFLTRQEKLYLWRDNRPLYDIENIPNSIDLNYTTFETMGLYITNKNALNHKKRIGKNPYMLKSSPQEAIDVNCPEDFELAELIARGCREKERQLLNNIKISLNSSILSDVLDDMGLKCIIKDMKINMPDAKILGRAKTLEIRELAKGEDYTGIYDALKTYEYIIPNDIIVVKNPIDGCAYFGELNASLAIRNGCGGAIISGYTRDSEHVKKTGLPVFYDGVSCQDVKTRATVKSFNKCISIQGVEIYPNDLVFGDIDGVVVIPKKKEKETLERAFKKIKTEKEIILDICYGEFCKNIINKHGFF